MLQRGLLGKKRRGTKAGEFTPLELDTRIDTDGNERITTEGDTRECPQ